MGEENPECVSDMLTDLYIGGKAVPAGDGGHEGMLDYLETQYVAVQR